jgi:uncharacterized protein (DUF2236 family)
MTAIANAQPSKPVSVEDLEHQLAFVRASAAGQREGVFGPRSLMWQTSREAAVFLSAGRALLLQLAHPWVAAAIADHSRTFDDPIGRFHRTFEVVYTMIFGTLEQAFASARRLHRRHATICGRLPHDAGAFSAGSSYYANEVAALTWVYATLIDSAFLTHNLVLPKMTREQRERYYTESRLFAGLFGIPQQFLPKDWSSFVSYNEDMWRSEILTVGSQARLIGRQLLSGAGTWLIVPQAYQALTAYLLPPRLRIGFGLRYSEADHLAAQRTIVRIRSIYPWLPTRLRFVGPYQEAQARLSGRGCPDLATQALNCLWIGRARLP